MSAFCLYKKSVDLCRGVGVKLLQNNHKITSYTLIHCFIALYSLSSSFHYCCSCSLSCPLSLRGEANFECHVYQQKHDKSIADLSLVILVTVKLFLCEPSFPTTGLLYFFNTLIKLLFMESHLFDFQPFSDLQPPSMNLLSNAVFTISQLLPVQCSTTNSCLQLFIGSVLSSLQ